VISVYAFVDAPGRLPAPEDADGAAVEALDVDGVVAVVGRVTRPAADPRTDAVRHGLVVEALARNAPGVVPVRFGERFADEGALREAVQPRVPALRRLLELVRGCVEIGVRVTAPRAAAVAATSGTEYLRARLAETSEAEMLHGRLAPLARASTGAAAGETAYLVERDAVAAAIDVVRGFAEERPAVAVAWSGPWAPYSFGGASR
jgi:hypothetical protein